MEILYKLHDNIKHRPCTLRFHLYVLKLLNQTLISKKF